MPEIFSNTTLTVNQLIEKIDTGELGLPELQRPFIWKDSKVRDLFDSMMRGYPIGYNYRLLQTENASCLSIRFSRPLGPNPRGRYAFISADTPNTFPSPQ